MLEIRKSTTGKKSFQNLGITITGVAPEQTSVVRAYELLQKDYDLAPIDILLYKNIPFGAGLGGGSADAGFMLKQLNDFFQLNITTAKLEDYASELGSDDPFFIKNTPQLATGRGEILQPVSVNLQGLYLVLLKPEIHISTAMAYQNITPKTASFNLQELPKLPLTKWKNNMQNDFEKGLFQQFPLLPKLKEELYESGAIYASLSGSGSALYGLFENQPKLSDIVKNNLLWQGFL